MVSIFLSCFCLLKVTETQSAYSSSGWSWLSCSALQKKWMLRSLTLSICRCSGLCTLRYSHERIAKKMPKVTSWVIACSSSELFCLLVLEMMEIGIAAWCFSAGSNFLNNLNSCCRINASCPSLMRVGFRYPCSQTVIETY